MHVVREWPIGLLEDIEIHPYIATRGPVPAWGQDRTGALPAYTWWEIQQGEVTVTAARQVTVARAAEWILIPHGLRRHQHFARSTRLISLNFRALWPTGKPIFDLSQPVVARKQEILSDLAGTICGIVEASGGDFAQSLSDRTVALTEGLRLRSLLLTFLRELIPIAQSKGLAISGPTSGDPRLDSILEDIRRDLNAGPLPYAQWASRQGIGRSQIDRLARQHLKSGFKAIRDSLLEDEIRHEFATGKLSSKELAAKYRFADAAHFSRWVRRMTGHAPKVLRQQFL